MKILTIGEVAKITNISVRTLRYYNEIGVIIPESKDENTGYRYYSDTQIIYLQMLKEFKSLGFSLNEIKSMIYGGNTNCVESINTLKNKSKMKLAEIENEIKKLEFQAESIHRAYEALDRGLNILSFSDSNKSESSVNETGKYEIHMLPEVWTLSIRRRSTLNADQLFLDRCFELQTLLDKYCLFQFGGLICILHDGFQSQFSDTYGDLELCIPFVKPEGFECPELKLFGGFLVASTIHVGHYKNAYDTYLSLIEWIFKEGYTIAGSPIEYYILDSSHLMCSDSYITKLCFPINK